MAHAHVKGIADTQLAPHAGQQTKPVGKLVSSTRPAASITLPERRAMWELYSRYYDGATFESFSLDLSEKTHVFMVYDSRDHILKGFSTVKVYDREVEGRRVIAIYSGDTIVHPDYWGQKTLHIAMFRYFAAVKLRHPFTKVFWFLVCNGYRTYLGFVRNVPSHWPRHDRRTPSWIRKVIHDLASERFGSDWVPSLGIVRFKSSLGLLKPAIAPIGTKEMTDPDIRFLVTTNPGYCAGDELACLGEIDWTLLMSFPAKCASKMIKSLFVKKPA